MYRFLNESGYQVAHNTHGILFNPLSIIRSLNDVMENKIYRPEDLFQLNEYWHSWMHHSDFSDLHPENALNKINSSIEAHHHFLKEARILILTLGSAFAYYHLAHGFYVSNNHRAPQQDFRRDLLEVSDIKSGLQQLLDNLHQFNPSLRVIFTISPVRHIREGLIDNNRSKARLIEAVHGLNPIYYFPAYELVMDVLRDYRFYDVDKAHPNYEATAYVWEEFAAHCLHAEDAALREAVEQLFRAARHKPRDTRTNAHQQFIAQQHTLYQSVRQQLPHLHIEEFML